jgi:hypothetical protein
MRQILILRSSAGDNPANFTVQLFDSLPVLHDGNPFQMRISEVALQPTVGEALPATPIEVRVTLGLPTMVWDSRARGQSSTLAFLQNFNSDYQHPWVTCSSGEPSNQINVSIRTLDGNTVPNLAYAVVTLTLKTLCD